jgi:uncharacterized membrane protein YkoI
VKKKAGKIACTTVLAASILAGGTVPYNVFAAEATPAAPAAENKAVVSKISREKAISIAKSFVNVPEGYSNTQVALENDVYIGRAIWRIGWNKQAPDFGDITVTIDAQEGTVLNMWSWSKEAEQNMGFPGKINDEQLVKDANELIQRFYPAYAGQMQLDKESLENVKKRSSSPYVNNMLFFQRHKDGIPVAEQGIRMNYDRKGNLRGVDFMWSELAFDGKNGIKSQQEISQAIGESLRMEVCYIPNLYGSGTKSKADIVYIPEGPLQPYFSANPITIDAKSGKQLNFLTGKNIDAAKEERKPLSDKEETVPNMLNYGEAEAINRVKEVIPMEAGMEIRQKSYREDAFPNKRRVWDIFWENKDKRDESKNTTVDADTGEIIGYNSNAGFERKMREPQAIKVNITQDQAREKAEAFVKKAVPARLGKLLGAQINPSLDQGDETKLLGYDVYFPRVEKGIRVINEGVNLTVDADTGQVINYNLNWSNVEMPPIANIISEETAKKKYLSVLKTKLHYSTFPPYFDGNRVGQKTKASKLVYAASFDNGKSPLGEPSYLNAKTGEWNQYGPKVVNNDKDKPAGDIANHWARKELEELIANNLLEVKDGKVNPDQKLTRAELIQLFQTASGNMPGYYGPEQKPAFADVADDKDYYSAVQWAVQQRILEQNSKEFKPDAPATREFLSVLLIRALGYDKLANRGDLFELPFKDAAAIKRKGEVGLISRLHIVTGNKNNEFLPEQQVTKAEAAVAIYHYIKTKEELGIRAGE